MTGRCAQLYAPRRGLSRRPAGVRAGLRAARGPAVDGDPGRGEEGRGRDFAPAARDGTVVPEEQRVGIAGPPASGRAFRLAVLCLALAAAGCGARHLVPVDGTAGGDPHRPMAQHVAGALTLSVQPQAWTARPEDLEKAFLPLRVVVRNASPEDVTLRPEDQVLEDDRGNVWRAVSPEQVAHRIAERTDASRRPTVHVGATGPAPTIWNLGVGLRRRRPPVLADIERLGFSENPVPPDASREGFFYFPLPSSGWRRLRLILTWTGGGFPRGQSTFEFAAE